MADATLMTTEQPNTNSGTPQTPNADAGSPSNAQQQTSEQKAVADKAAVDAAAKTRADELAKMSPEDRTKAEAADKAAKDAADKAKQGAPEKYGDFKLTDGVTLDAELMTEFQGVAKELNLTQDQAQTLVGIANKMSVKQGGQLATVVEKARGEWAEQSKADKEFGGDRLNENLAVAQKAREMFATPEFTTLLNESGLGNHPEVIRTFYRVGKAISEDGHVIGSRGHEPAAGDRQEHLANKLYGGTNRAA